MAVGPLKADGSRDFIPDAPTSRAVVPGSDSNYIPPDQSSADGAALRAGGRSALPTAGGFAGAETLAPVGAAAGALVGGPIGAAIGGIGGGIIGALGGSALTSYAQNEVFKAAPDLAAALGQSPDQQAADEAEHPIATFIGGALPQAALLRPSGEVFDLLKGGSTAAKAAGTVLGGAAIQGSLEAGQEYAQDGKIDPTKVALSAAQGALFNKKTALGEALSVGHTDVIGRPTADPSGGIADAEQPTDDTSAHVQSGSNLLALPAATPDQIHSPESLHPDAATQAPPKMLTDQVGETPIDQPAPAPQPLLADPNAPIDAEFTDVPDVGQGPNRAPPSPPAAPLALTDQSPPIPAAGPVTHLLPAPTPPEPVGVGSTRTPPEPPQPYAALTDQTKPMIADVSGNIAAPQPDLNFSRADILQRLRLANPKADGSPGAINQLTNNLSLNLAAKFATGDVQGAADVVQPHLARVTADEFAGRQREANIVAAAVKEVSEFKKQQDAKAPPAPIVPAHAAAPSMDPTPGPVGPAAEPAAPVDAGPITGTPDPETPHLAPDTTPGDAYEQGHRDALLSGVLDNPDSHTPTASFLDQLRTKGHDDTIRPQEAQRIADFEKGKAAAEQAQPEPAQGEPHGDQTPSDAEVQPAGQGEQSPAAPEEGSGPQEPGGEDAQAGQEPVREGSVDAEAPEPAGPTDAQMSDKIDQLFRDKVISAKERAQFKALQEQVGTDGKMMPAAELNDRIDHFTQAKEGTSGTADFKQAEPKQVRAPNGAVLAAPDRAAAAVVRTPTYASLKERVNDLHTSGVMDTDTHQRISNQIADRQMSPGRISARVDKVDAAGKLRVSQLPAGEDHVSPIATAAMKARADALIPALRAELDKVGLHHVSLRLAPSLRDNAYGSFKGGLLHQISLSMSHSDADAVGTLHHEMIHAMRDAGMFSAEEWKTLEAAAAADPESAAVDAAYPDLSGEALAEERVAEMFRRSYDQPTPTTFVGRMVQRIQKLFAAVKAALTKSGASADDIIGKVKSGEIGSREMREPTSAGGAEAKARKMLDEDKTDPMHVTAADAYDGLTGKGRRVMLNLSTFHQIAEGVAKTPIGAIADRLADNLNQASQVKSDRVAEGAHVQAGWAKLSKGDRDALGKALFAANDAGVDVRVKGATGPEADKFNALSPEAKAVFAAAQDHLEHQKDAYIKIMSDTGMAGDGDAASKARDIAALKKSLSRVAYFTNMRIGDFTNVATKPEFHASKARVESAKAALADTSMTPEEAKVAHENYKTAQAAHEVSSQENYAVTQHESREEQNAVAREMEAAGYTVSKMRSKQYQPAVHGPATALMSRLDAAWAADSAAHPERAAGNAGLQRMAHEIAGSMRPEGSALRNIMQRKGVAGYNTDAMRVFSIASRRNSGFLAAMETGEKLRQGLADIENRIKAMPAGTDTTKLDEVSQQLNKHFGALAKYSEQPVQTFLTNASYAWFLGCSPSFMMSHLMQTPLVTMPMLAAHFNPGRVAWELGKAFGEVTTHIGNLNEGKEATWGNTPLEKAAIRFAMEHATITSTHSDQFLGAGDKSSLAADIGGRVMRTASFLPHYTEKANRVATLLASIRMAKDNPKFEAQLSDERYQMMLKDQPWLAGHTKQEVAAMKFANQITLDSHVDYSRENMSYVMQPGVTPMGKLMFQFQKYQQAMIYALAKNAGASFDKNLSGDEQWVARKTLAGIVGTHTLLTGLMGFPMAGLVATATNVYHKLVGDKNDPYDADDRFRTMLEQHLGKDAGDVAARGLLYAPGIRDVLPGDVTDRLGMGDLLVSGNAADGAIDRNSLLQYFGSLVGGPAGSLMVNISQAAIDHGQGDNWKASEELMPKVMRDVSRTVRFSMDGVTTSSNNPVVKPGELSTMDLVAQAMGFTPQKIETAYANRATVQDAKAELDARRKVLLKEFTDVSLDSSSDPTQVQAMRDKINAYNAEQRSKGLYSETINGSEMVRSVQQRRLASIRLNNGISLSPKQRGLINEYSSDGTPPPQ